MFLSSAIKTIVYTPLFYFLAMLRMEWWPYVAAAYVCGAMGFTGSATSMMLASAVRPADLTSRFLCPRLTCTCRRPQITFKRISEYIPHMAGALARRGRHRLRLRGGRLHEHLRLLPANRLHPAMVHLAHLDLSLREPTLAQPE